MKLMLTAPQVVKERKGNMMVVTSGAGFIGSALIWKLNQEGRDDIIAVDSFSTGNKWKNLRKRKLFEYVDKEELFGWLDSNSSEIDTIVHLGACTDTTEDDVKYMFETNYCYSKRLWKVCSQEEIRFIYASSGATYGAGEHGYSDDLDLISELRPLNPYGLSKHLFDRWVLGKDDKPPQWVGLKFFNVYGPNEYHKGQMSSVFLQATRQAQEDGIIRLFKSYRGDYADGEQKRDFIYVKDIIKVISYFLKREDKQGIFNVGTGKARTFDSLANAVFEALGMDGHVEYIEMPDHLTDQYQYFTEAEIDKLREAGYTKDFHWLEDGIKDYVQCYLDTDDIYL